MSTTLTATIPLSVAEDPVQYRIVVATPPTKTSYDEGDKLATAGIVVNLEKYTAKKGVLQTTNVTSSCTFSPANNATLSTSDTSFTVTYTSTATGTLTAKQEIEVVSLTEIKVNETPLASLKQAAVNGNLTSVLEEGDVIYLEYIEDGTMIPFRCIQVNNNAATFDILAIKDNIYQSSPWFGKTFSQKKYIFSEDVCNLISGEVFSISAKDVIDGKYDYYLTEKKRLKYYLDSNTGEIQFDKPHSWGNYKAGTQSNGSSITGYIGNNGKYNETRYSLANNTNFAFVINNE